MSLWGSLFGKKDRTIKVTSFPHQEEFIKGQVTVEIYHHSLPKKIGSGDAWTYVTRGLIPQLSYELVITLQRPANHDRLRPFYDPITTFGVPFDALQKGLDPLKIKFSSFVLKSGPLQRWGLAGALYVPAEKLPDIPVERGYCNLILVTKDELEWSHSFSQYRVLTRRGNAERYYPHPYWNDLERRPVIAPNEPSMLRTPLPIIRTPGVCVSKRGDRLELLLQGSQQDNIKKIFSTLSKDLGTEFSLAFLGTYYPPDTAGMFVSKPGAEAPVAIMPSLGQDIVVQGHLEPRLVGGFMLLSGGIEKPVLRLGEDGFGVVLNKQQWSSFIEALLEGRPYGFGPEGDNEVGFSLVWES
jgi:hypothetical protein